MDENRPYEEQFVRSCNEAAWFPRNIVNHDTYDHNLKAYVGRLDTQESSLFCDESKACVNLLDCDDKLQSKKYLMASMSRKSGKTLN